MGNARSRRARRCTATEEVVPDVIVVSDAEEKSSSEQSTTSDNDERMKNIPSPPSSSSDGGGGGMEDEYGEMTNDGHTYVHPKPYILESGEVLHNAQVRYMTYGTLNTTRDNVLVVCHALSGNASLHSWWGDLLGDGLAFDTQQYFVVCCNILGSCYGSTGPNSIIPGTTNKKYGASFPDVTVRDNVRLQLHMLQDDLKIHSVKCVIGGSFGGMQVVEYSVQAGTTNGPFTTLNHHGHTVPFIRSVLPIACGATHNAWQIAMSEVQRQAIYADSKWNNGQPSMDDLPLKGLSVARQIAMVSYRTAHGYESKFARRLKDDKAQYGSKAKWQVKSYLEYQGKKILDKIRSRNVRENDGTNGFTRRWTESWWSTNGTLQRFHTCINIGY